MTTKLNVNPFLFLLVLILGSCASADFIANDFKSKTINHKTVAVLPVEMVLLGNQPKDLKENQIKLIEEGESKAFQLSLYNNLLKKSGPKKKDIKISFQSPDKTLRLLNDNNISIRNSWSATPENLAEQLGVDAVIKSKVEKTRYMSDLASYGIDIGISILDGVFGGVGAPIPYGVSKTNDINAECSLFNGTDGSLLYKDVYQRSTDFNTPANEMIEHLTKKFSKTFPYRD